LEANETNLPAGESLGPRQRPAGIVACDEDVLVTRRDQGFVRPGTERQRPEEGAGDVDAARGIDRDVSPLLAAGSPSGALGPEQLAVGRKLGDEDVVGAGAGGDQRGLIELAGPERRGAVEAPVT